MVWTFCQKTDPNCSNFAPVAPFTFYSSLYGVATLYPVSAPKYQRDRVQQCTTSFGAFNTQSILADQLFPLCNIHTNIFRKSTQIFLTNIQTNIEGESRRIYCIQCSLNSGRVASSFSPEQFHSTQDFCLNQSIVEGTTSQKGFVLHVVVVENIAKVQS